MLDIVPHEASACTETDRIFYYDDERAISAVLSIDENDSVVLGRSNNKIISAALMLLIPWIATTPTKIHLYVPTTNRVWLLNNSERII
jgi:hypothetical protein